MTSDYMFLALCLLVTQIPGFLTKPSDLDGYGDERQRPGEIWGELNGYDHPKPIHNGLKNNQKLVGRRKASVMPQVKRLKYACEECGMTFGTQTSKWAHMLKKHGKIQKPKMWLPKARQGEVPLQQDQGLNEMEFMTLEGQDDDTLLTDDIKSLIVDAIYNYNTRRIQQYFS